MFVLVDIGCIECGESTRVYGAYETRAEATEAFARACEVRKARADGEYFDGGQHYIEVLEVVEPFPREGGMP